jgi:hypothetical protein
MTDEQPDQQATAQSEAATAADDHTVASQARRQDTTPPLAPEPDGRPADDRPPAWAQDPVPPRRPRRRVLAPAPVALLLVLLTACGFIAGVLVEKGQGSSAGAAATRLPGLANASTRAAAGGGGRGAFPGGGGATIGQVSFVEGSTLYVTDTQGTTVKVTTSPASTVTKAVSSNVAAIHPGETVVISGSAGKDGVVSAESIRVGSVSGGGLASLFGGGTPRGAGTGGSGGTGGGGPALFGPG